MTQPLAYFNGRVLPLSEVAVPVYDAGFLQGTTVAEQLRTFGGRLFQLNEHLDRLWRSLEIVGVQPAISQEELLAAAEQIARHNHSLLAEADDLGMSIFVTPGPYPTMAPEGEHGPMVCIHTYPLPFRLWADKYEHGESLWTTSVEQVSTRSWPAQLKCRSRMHYYLADRVARAREPGARALMHDAEGFVTESTTANVLLYGEGRGLLTPPKAKVLPGISLAVVVHLANQLGIPLIEQDISPEMLAAADEVMLTSTSPCVLPVVRFNGGKIGSGAPGPVQGRLLAAWSDLVGLDIAAQSRRFAAR